MKNYRLLLAPIFALFLAVQTFAQGINSITVNPSAPNTGSYITADINYYLSNSCWSYVGYNSYWSGNTLYVDMNFDFSGGWCAQVFTYGTQNLSIGYLSAGTYQIQVYDSDTWAYLQGTTFTVSSAGCNAPSVSQLFASNVTCTNARLNCSATGVLSYDFRAKRTTTATWTVRGTNSSNYWDVALSAQNATYEFQVRTLCTNGVWSNWSSSRTFTNPCGGGTSCGSPITLNCGQTYYGNNFSGNNYWNSYAGTQLTGMTGREVYHVITLNSTTNLTLNLTGLSADLDLILLSSCSNNSVITTSDNPNNSNEYISWTLNPGTYYVVVDGWNGAQSNFSLSVQCNSAGCSAPTASQIWASNVTSTSARLSTSVSGAQQYHWAYRQSGSSTWTELFTSTPYVDIFNLSPGTSYIFILEVRCNNIWSGWSPNGTFSTPGGSGNDEVCGSTTIYANSFCNTLWTNNYGATTTWNPAPPTNCESYSSSPKDVWFRFQMPASGVATIRLSDGGIGDAVMAVYGGNDCNSLYYVVCEDDNNNGNGSGMPVITVYGSEYENVWVRVWGWNGRTGSFGICVLNYSTANKGGTGEDGEVTEVKLSEPQTNIEERSENIGSEKTMGFAAAELKIYPVPATDFINVALVGNEDSEATLQIEILDASGRTVKTLNQTAASGERIEISDLPAGTYFVKAKSESTLLTGKFLKVQQP